MGGGRGAPTTPGRRAHSSSHGTRRSTGYASSTTARSAATSVSAKQWTVTSGGCDGSPARPAAPAAHRTCARAARQQHSERKCTDRTTPSPSRGGRSLTRTRAWRDRGRRQQVRRRAQAQASQLAPPPRRPPPLLPHPPPPPTPPPLSTPRRCPPRLWRGILRGAPRSPESRGCPRQRRGGGHWEAHAHTPVHRQHAATAGVVRATNTAN